MNPDDTMDMGDEQVAPGHGGEGGSPWFVDRIEGDKAVVLQGTESITVPVEMLPKGVQEGQFFDPQSGAVVDQPDEAGPMRAKLSAGDDGADIDLGGEPDGDPDDVEMAANVGDADGPDDATGVSPAMLRKIRGLNGAEPMPDDPMEPTPGRMRVKGVPNMSKVRM